MRKTPAPRRARLAAGLARAEGPVIRNYTAPGNLESRHAFGCIPLDQAQPAYTPVDLYRAVKACIDAERYDDAFRLFALAGAYGRFDAARVVDSTAHQAVIVARMEIIGEPTPTQSAAFSQAVKRLTDDPAALGRYCAQVARIGPPDYYPRYRVRHGINAFIGGDGDGLVTPFDPAQAWSQAMAGYLKCSVG